jgi:acyl-CoA thioesterase-1
MFSDRLAGVVGASSTAGPPAIIPQVGGRIRTSAAEGFPMLPSLGRIVTAVLLALALCTGCGKHGKVRPLSNSSVVVAFGDSLTSGTGAGQAESYPLVLSELLRCRVVNAGVPGEVTSSGRLRLQTVLEKDKADLVILCHGGNDMVQKQDEGATIRNLDAMISFAKQSGADVVLVGVPKPEYPLKVPGFYQELASKHGIPLDSDTIAEILSSSALRRDQMHPNAAGYRKLAEAIAHLIRESQGASH